MRNLRACDMWATPVLLVQIGERKTGEEFMRNERHDMQSKKGAADSDLAAMQNYLKAGSSLFRFESHL